MARSAMSPIRASLADHPAALGDEAALTSTHCLAARLLAISTDSRGNDDKLVQEWSRNTVFEIGVARLIAETLLIQQLDWTPAMAGAKQYLQCNGVCNPFYTLNVYAFGSCACECRRSIVPPKQTMRLFYLSPADRWTRSTQS